MLCQLCYEEMIPLQYKIETYKTFIYCYDCLQELLNTQWYDYIKGLKTDCQASLTRLINLGPPMNYRDFAIDEGKEIDNFLYQDHIIEAKLKGSFEGNKRLEFWQDLKTLDINEVLYKYNL